MPPLPIHTRDASRRESVWQSHVKLRTIEQLAWKHVASGGLHQECLVPKSDAAGHRCSGEAAIPACKSGAQANKISRLFRA